MSKQIQFDFTSKEGEQITVSGESAEVKDIAKMVLARSNPLMGVIGALSIVGEKRGFDFNETIEKPMKSKAIIKKVNAHTVEVEGQKLSLKELVNVEPGTDYYVFKTDEGKYLLEKIKSGTHLVPIGGFHYGVIPEDFKAINNISKKEAKKISGINAYSIWDENHRPTCNPEGMFYIPKLDTWFDIYLLNADHKEAGTSAAGHPIAAGNENRGRKKPHGEKNLVGKVIDAIAKHHGKRLLTKDEFQIAAYGVKENVSANDLDDGTTKFIEDFTSKYGMIQSTGVQWVWTSTPFGDNEDGEDRRYLVGGFRISGYLASSSFADWDYFGAAYFWGSGVRFACNPLNPKVLNDKIMK